MPACWRPRPALAQFRARFVGTLDMQPALALTGSRVHVSRPKTALKHVSTPINLVTASQHIHVLETLENFDETPHDHAIALRVGAATVTATTVTTKLTDADAKRYEREAVFDLGATTSSFRVVTTASTTSPQNTFHVAERDFYTL